MAVPTKAEIDSATERVYTDVSGGDPMALAASVQFLAELVDRVPAEEQPSYCPEALGALELGERMSAALA